MTQSAIGDFCRYAAKRPPIATGIAVNFVAEPMLASGLDQSQNMTTLSRCYTSYEPMSSRAEADGRSWTCNNFGGAIVRLIERMGVMWATAVDAGARPRFYRLFWNSGGS